MSRLPWVESKPKSHTMVALSLPPPANNGLPGAKAMQNNRALACASLTIFSRWPERVSHTSTLVRHCGQTFSQHVNLAPSSSRLARRRPS